MLSATPSGQIERPDLESNQDQDLRRVLCIRYTIGTISHPEPTTGFAPA